MTRYFMRDTPLCQMEQQMMTPPYFKPRGHGRYYPGFQYSRDDMECPYCMNFRRNHPCPLEQCVCLDERIVAGAIDLNEFVRDCFFPEAGVQLQARLGENGTLLISSGLLFLLVALYYNIEISSPSADAVQYKDRLLTWSEKYQITDAQIDTEQNAASNAECIEAIFNRYVRSTEQTIFMSRCFSAEYNETENAIRRAINEINNEKKTGIMLIRVDEHHEGTTGQISDRIFRDIESAGLVIADLSSGKLNVPHEIGYAMGLKKDLILVHNGTSEEAEKHIPSNIRMFEQIRFNGDYQTLQNEIKRRLIDYYKL